MRFKRTGHNEPKVGDRRTIKRFLGIPTTIGDERRWLECSEIEQEYTHWREDDDAPNFADRWGWRNRRWKNE